MDQLTKRLEEAIVKELERILLLLRIGSWVGLLGIFVSTPMPWKPFVMAPFLLGPVLAWLLPRLPDRPSPAEAAERARVRAVLNQAPTGMPSPPTQSAGRAAPVH